MAEKVKKTSTASKPRAGATKKKAASSKVNKIKASYEDIAMLAHRFWFERGQNHGNHEEDWFRAEQELVGKAS